MLTNFNNYNMYAELVRNNSMIVDMSTINKHNLNEHFMGIVSIMRDSIETEFMVNTFLTLKFDKDMIEMTIPDYFFNLIMMHLIVETDQVIKGKHIFFDENLTKNSIKTYIDNNFIKVNKTLFSNKRLNNIIDDCLQKFIVVDEFAFYFANTINLEDTITLMNGNSRFKELIHADLSNVPLEEVKTIGMELTYEAIDYMKNSDHCLSDAFRANEGINPKQLKEFMINGGSKPDGRGGVYPTIINNNYLTGGVNSFLSCFIESSTGRVAQIIVEGNVGVSGYFARLLGLNSMDTLIHQDPHYVCESTNFQIIDIKNEMILRKFDDRFYRLNPNGMEYLLDQDDKSLIGKTIYLRSPMTCASHSRGEGICYRCYGLLAHTNNDINIGKIAAEETSSKLTQMMLSAKHLLESAIKVMTWSTGFRDLFEVDYNMIKIIDGVDLSGYRLLVDPTDIHIENEFEKQEFNEYMSTFQILCPDDSIIDIHTSDSQNMYLTSEFNTIIRQHGKAYDDKIAIDINHIKDVHILLMQIHNNELSRILDRIKAIIDKNAVTKSYNRHQLLQELVETLIEGNLDVMGIHAEIILSNQLRNVDDILEKPEWQYLNEPCDVLTLNQALTNNPSIVVSLSYEKVSKTLYNPLSYRKHKPSFLDLFFMKTPHLYLNNEEIVKADKSKYIVSNAINPVIFGDDPDTIDNEQCDK